MVVGVTINLQRVAWSGLQYFNLFERWHHGTQAPEKDEAV
jgi:hypothetical protein